MFEKYFNVHLKFTVYGRNQASIHTHFRNAGLAQACPNYAPINFLCGKSSCKYLMKYEHGFVAMTTVMPHNSEIICYHGN